MQPDETGELLGLPLFNSPEAPAPFVDELRDSFGKAVALRSGPQRWIIAHDIDIGIDRREWCEVRWSPLSESKAGSEEIIWGQHTRSGVISRASIGSAVENVRLFFS